MTQTNKKNGVKNNYTSRLINGSLFRKERGATKIWLFNSISDSIRLGEEKQHVKFGNSSYTFYGSSAGKLTWERSNQHCKDTGSKLVSIESQEKWEFLKNTIQGIRKTKEYFIGLKKDSESEGWRWISDNSKVAAIKGKRTFAWASHEPSGDGNCAEMYNFKGNIGKFNDLRCTGLYQGRGHICERSAVDNTGQEGMLHKLFFLFLTY